MDTADVNIKSNRIKNIDGLLFVFRLDARLQSAPPTPRLKAEQLVPQDSGSDSWPADVQNTSHCQRPFRQTKLNSAACVLEISRVWLLDDTNLLQIAFLHLVSFLWLGNNNIISKRWHWSHPIVFCGFFFLFVCFVSACSEPHLRRQKWHL